MQVQYPSASWRPLGTQSEPRITPRILVFHTMVGYLKSTDSLFRGQGYTGTESHFGVGGPWDGAALDGNDRSLVDPGQGQGNQVRNV